VFQKSVRGTNPDKPRPDHQHKNRNYYSAQ